MSRRRVTPADGSAAVTFEWDHSQVTLPAGTMLEIGSSSMLEFVIGAENLTALDGATLTAERTGSGSSATHNA